MSDSVVWQLEAKHRFKDSETLSECWLNNNSITLAEFDHAQLALKLEGIFTIESLAEFLHQNYRAADKAMNREKAPKRGLFNLGKHDHGFKACHNKQYFLRRAASILDPFGAISPKWRREKVEQTKPIRL